MKRMLTTEEASKIQELRITLTNWPKSLSLFGRSGVLEVLIDAPYDGTSGSHQEHVAATIGGVWADGGDP